MKKYKHIRALFVAVVAASTACTNDEPISNAGDDCQKIGEIECNIESSQSENSRTYYEAEYGGNTYRAKWNLEDRIAMCFDNSEAGKEFKIKSGENSDSAVFYGPIPDNYKEITAVYPFDIFRKHSSSSIEIELPETIRYDEKKILNGIMPMYAHGSSGTLNFYNLMAAMKISVKGTGLLKFVTVFSLDGYGLSGNGQITPDENNLPIVSFNDKTSPLTIDLGAMFLSSNILDLYIPIPAKKYENGFKLEFQFEGEGKVETRELGKEIIFERSVLRSVQPYEINIPFDFDTYQPKNNEIWYEASSKQDITKNIESELGVIGNSYCSDKELGVITTCSAIEKISGPLFITPKSVSSIVLPNPVKELGMNSLKDTSIKSFEAPESLRIIGTDAFLNCTSLKRVVLNDGVESLGLEVFGNCPNLEYVYLPKSLNIIGAYVFLYSAGNLEQWYGDCQLIDKDRHALYSNSSYGMVSSNLTMVDVIAGKNLTEYSIPENALSTQNYAFYGCGKLKKLTIHKNFRSFGFEFFSSLPSLETIVCHATTPPRFNSDENVESKSLKEIKVPRECVDLYKKADGWKKFADKILPM